MNPAPFPRDLRRIIDFHGHFCGGILIGYRAAKEALKRLGIRRADDEELVAIVENDSCAVDAVQVLTGCTFGKGNLFYRDHGKHVYTFAVRSSGRAVRLSRKPGPHPDPDVMLSAPAEQLFWIDVPALALPEAARIHESIPCARCGEPVMATRVRHRGDRVLCIPCASRAATGVPRPPLRHRPRGESGAAS